jgi:protein subunit release factor A
MILEIRAAEGGADAKLLVSDQVTIYAKRAVRRGL